MRDSATKGLDPQQEAIIDWNIVETDRGPFPHVVKSPFIKPEIYAALKKDFPEGLPGGRSGFGLRPEQPEYGSFLASNSAWASLVENIRSQEFIDYVIKQFGDELVQQGCTLDLDKAKYVDFIETKENRKSSGLTKNDLFIRVDIQQAKMGYTKGIHTDKVRRFCSLTLSFCDKDTIGLVGGGLGLFTESSGTAEPVKTVEVRDNSAMIFPRWPNSFHAVMPIEKIGLSRNFLFIAISSTQDIWEGNHEYSPEAKRIRKFRGLTARIKSLLKQIFGVGK